MNKLFVANKPIFISSNRYMSHFKRKLNTKKIGFSGTLDPFATGCLIVATGQYTKLFNYIDKTPKQYQATLWLGVTSPTLDIEMVETIEQVRPFDSRTIEETLHSFIGDFTYTPPQFCAKKIDGVASYKNAREGVVTKLKETTSHIYNLELCNYNHPFVTFLATVSEGTYIRSLGAMVAEKLGVTGVLSSLQRISEGRFKFTNEKSLCPLEFISLPHNKYLKNIIDIELGKKLCKEDFTSQNDGLYLVCAESFFSILEIGKDGVQYKINKMPL